MLRTAVSNDIENIIDIHSSAFSYEDDSSKIQKLRNTLESDLAGWLVYESGEDVVGCLRIRSDRIRIGCGVLLKGEVGKSQSMPVCMARDMER